jgi:mono/diheme cytochrome c family protein
MRRMFMVTAAAAFGLILIPGTAYSQDQAAAKGMEVFTTQKCNTCHSIGGKGAKKGPLDDVGSRLTAAEIRQWLIDPVGMAAKREPKSTRKPPMKKKPMTEDDLNSLVGLLSGLRK